MLLQILDSFLSVPLLSHFNHVLRSTPSSYHPVRVINSFPFLSNMLSTFLVCLLFLFGLSLNGYSMYAFHILGIRGGLGSCQPSCWVQFSLAPPNYIWRPQDSRAVLANFVCISKVKTLALSSDLLGNSVSQYDGRAYNCSVHTKVSSDV